MKKSIGIVTLAVCALTITSCGAPEISRDEALAEANQIRERVEVGGEAAAGNKLELNYKIKNEQSGLGVKASSSLSGYVHIDVDNLYVRTHIETKESFSGYEGNGSHSSSSDFYAFKKDALVYLGTVVKENGQTTVDEHSSFSLGEYESEIVEAIKESYATIDDTFSKAINMIFTVLQSYSSDELLKAAGITLGSYGEGSLVITEDINVSAQGRSQKSYAVVEFEDYRLKTMKSDVSAKYNGVSESSFIEYNFKYGGCPLNYSTK